MNESARHFPEQESESTRAAELLQSFYDETITEEDSAELLRIWAASPRLEREARDGFVTESVFRFLDDSRQRLSPPRLERLRQEFKIRSGLAANIETALMPDFDELSRLAAESHVLPTASTSLPFPEETPPTSTYAGIPLEKTAGRASSRTISPTILIPLILVLFGVAVYFEWNPPSERDHMIDAVSRKTSAVAVVTRVADVRWDSDRNVPEPGVPLLPGTLRFESGTIELLFFNGVRSVVEGPAELVLLDEKQVFCRRGNWSVSVPPQGTGFEIQTSQWNIRDIGTRFFASIDEKQCDVHVVRGVVELNKPDAEPVVLKENRGVRFGISDSVGKTLADILFEAGRFVDPFEMRRRSDAFSARSGIREPALETLKAAAVRSIDFEKEPPGDVTMFGGFPVEGRTPDSRAFRLDDRNARLRLNSLGTLESATVVLDLRINRLQNGLNPIFMSEGAKRGGILWHVSSKGTMLIGLRYRDSRRTELIETPVLFTPEMLGTWTRLVLILDAPRCQATVCQDGVPIFSEKISLFPPLDFSAVDIGNWKPKAGQRENAAHLDADIGSITIFDRVLDLHEIRALEK